jgi:hypothetical protein
MREEHMTLEQLEQRVHDLERQVADLRRAIQPLGPLNSVQETFGMFANDPEFDEIIRYGREYRRRADTVNDAAFFD